MQPLARIALALAALTALTAAAAASAASAITLHDVGYVTIPPREGRTLTVPYPDALRYGNARYSATVALVLPSHALAGRVQILESGAVLGGSEYRVRARNRNTRPVRLQLTATTVEPLPHS